MINNGKNEQEDDQKNFSNLSEFDDNTSYLTSKLKKKVKEQQFDDEIE